MLALLLPILALAGEPRPVPESFQGLTPVERDGGPTGLYYGPSSAVALDEPLDSYYDARALLKTPIASGGDPVTIAQSSGVRGHLSWLFWQGVDHHHKATLEVRGDRLFVPGNGCVYVEALTSPHGVARKFCVGPGGLLSEVEQPLGYLGVRTRLVTPTIHEEDGGQWVFSMRLARDRDSPVVSMLTEGAPVDVLLTDGNHWFLVRSPFGLVGWYASNHPSFTSIGIWQYDVVSTRRTEPDPEVPDSFAGLAHKPVDEGIDLFHSQEHVEVLDRLLTEPDAPVSTTALVRLRLRHDRPREYTVGFSPGPSADPTWIVWEGTDTDAQPLIEVAGKRLFIPGTGHLYVDGWANTMFDHRRKYVLTAEGGFEEVRQPMKYVGLQTTVGWTRFDPSLHDQEVSLKLLQDQRPDSEPVAVLPKGAPIEVLVADGEWYLVRTSLGLVGWVHVEDGSDQSLIGISFAGD